MFSQPFCKFSYISKINDNVCCSKYFENNKNAINVQKKIMKLSMCLGKNVATQLVHFIMSNGILPLKKLLN
jgi:hypothetical protein